MDPLAAAYTAGLVNLGNTCYMASTVQCLSVVPELTNALDSYSASTASADPTAHKLSVATRDLIADMRRSKGRAVAPFRMLMSMRERFPQFAQQGEGGAYMQQDAEECWTQLLQTYAVAFRSPTQPYVSCIASVVWVGPVLAFSLEANCLMFAERRLRMRLQSTSSLCSSVASQMRLRRRLRLNGQSSAIFPKRLPT